MPDHMGRAEYRVDAGFVFGYAVLYARLFLFGWDPHYVFLGVAVELVILSIGSLVKGFVVARGAAAGLALRRVRRFMVGRIVV